MTAKQHVARVATLVAALAFAAPALADPPQLRTDEPVVAADGWAVPYVTNGSAAARHPDGGPRQLPPQPAAAVDPGTGSAFDWQVGLVGLVLSGLGVAALAAIAVRTRTRPARA